MVTIEVDNESKILFFLSVGKKNIKILQILIKLSMKIIKTLCKNADGFRYASIIL